MSLHLQSTRKKSRISVRHLKSLFLQDIIILGITLNAECFKIASEFFVKKWSDLALQVGDTLTNGIKVTLDHFEEVWINGQASKWYRGAAEGHPMNNNGLESLNGVLKKEVTNHLLVPFEDFLVNTFKWFSFESICRRI